MVRTPCMSLSERFRQRTSALLVVCVLVASTALSLGAQTSCSVPQVGRRQTRTCSVTLSTTLQIGANALLTLSHGTTNVFNTAAMSADAAFRAAADTGLRVMGPTFRVSATRAVSVTVANAPTFNGPVAKSAADVSLGVSPVPNVCSGASMLPLSSAPMAVQQAAPRVLMQSNAPSNNVVRQVCFRVFWRYASDPPGTYGLPLTFSLTAP